MAPATALSFCFYCNILDGGQKGLRSLFRKVLALVKEVEALRAEIRCCSVPHFACHLLTHIIFLQIIIKGNDELRARNQVYKQT